MLETLQATPHLSIMEASVEDLIVEGDQVKGIILPDGSHVTSKSVILTTGTFLSAMIHIGSERIPAGRVGDAASYGLSGTLRRTGFQLGRLKTGTPPRLDGRSINFTGLAVEVRLATQHSTHLVAWRCRTQTLQPSAHTQ